MKPDKEPGPAGLEDHELMKAIRATRRLIEVATTSIEAQAILLQELIDRGREHAARELPAAH